MTNPLFDYVTNTNEQRLVQDLVAEAISIHGVESYYVVRTTVNPDEPWGEDRSSTYDRAFPLDLYLKSAENFQGEGVIMDKLAFQIRDRTIFTVSNRTFDEEVGSRVGLSRPREGDLVYYPLDKRVYQVKFVEKYATLYQVGALQSWDLICELFEYGSEIFNTGIPEIDALQARFSENFTDWTLTTGDGESLLTSVGDFLVVGTHDSRAIDPLDDSDDLQTQSDAIMDWSENDPFSGGSY